ncbi:hypothetical protein OSTOST_25715 [Ostertagia ostertagi]
MGTSGNCLQWNSLVTSFQAQRHHRQVTQTAPQMVLFRYQVAHVRLTWGKLNQSVTVIRSNQTKGLVARSVH